MKEIKLVIADDHILVQEGLKRAIFNRENQSGIKLLFTAQNGKDLLKKLETEPHPDIILMDITMPIMGGFEATILIKEQFPLIKVIALTMHDLNRIRSKIISSKFDGCVSKESAIKKLLLAINTVYNGNSFFPEVILPKSYIE